jgi:hypothetical protein
MKSILDDLELYQEACDAYFQWCDLTGLDQAQPDKNDSETDRKYVYLRNANGLLAKYDIQKKAIEEGE